VACREEHAGALGFARFLTDGKKSPAISLPCLCFAARLGKGMTGGAHEEREGMTGGPNLAVRGKGLTGGVVAGLLCGNRFRMGVGDNFNWF